MNLCGTDNLLELKQGDAGPAGSSGAGEVTEILSIRGALSIPYKPGTFNPMTNGNASHTFDEIIRTKTVADPSGVFQAIESADFTLGGSPPGEPNGRAKITLKNFLNTPTKKFSANVNLNAPVRLGNVIISEGTALPNITDSSVGLPDGINQLLNLNIIDIDENEIVIGIFLERFSVLWKTLLQYPGRGFYYTLTIFAVKD